MLLPQVQMRGYGCVCERCGLFWIIWSDRADRVFFVIFRKEIIIIIIIIIIFIIIIIIVIIIGSKLTYTSRRNYENDDSSPQAFFR